MSTLIAQTGAEAHKIMVTDPAGVLAVLLAVLAAIFWFNETTPGKRLFKILPALLFCYFIPTTLSTLHIIPSESELYAWIKAFLLPASLLLLVLALDVPAVLRLGPKAIIVLLAGTLGVVIGGPISLAIFHSKLPEDVWRGMAALSGSWIGGGANFVAIGQAADATDEMMGQMVVVDVFCASVWMAVLLYLSGHQHRIDKWTRANASAIRDLEERISDYQAQTRRIPSLTDYLLILSLAFVGSYASYALGNGAVAYALKPVDPATDGTLAVWTHKSLKFLYDMIGDGAWKYIIATTIGLVLSFTPARRLDGAGASRIGSVMIYLLVTCIGASASFKGLHEYGWLIAMGGCWMAVHVVTLLFVAWLVRAPIFFVAVGSQSNIGGAASAPIVASAFHPSLAPVGALLAVVGYVLGTYAGLLCMKLLQAVAQTEGA
jgi:uncharacterized membrane protein